MFQKVDSFPYKITYLHSLFPFHIFFISVSILNELLQKQKNLVLQTFSKDKKPCIFSHVNNL